MKIARIGVCREVRGVMIAAGIAASAFNGLALAQDTKPAAPPAPATPPATPAAPAAAAEKLPSADEIMDKYIASTGGKENWAKFKTMTMTGKLDIPSAGISGKMSSWVGEAGKTLSTIDLTGFGEVKEGSDGETVWSIEPNSGPRILDGDERELRLAIAKLSNPLDWKKLFTKVEVAGVEDVDKKPAYKVIGTVEAGKKLPITQYFDKESGLVTKVEVTMTGPEGEIPMEMFPTEYKEVGGVKISHKSKRVIMKMIEMTETIEKMEVNAEIPADKFALPKEIQEIKDAKSKPKEEKPKDEKKPAADAPKPDKK